MIEDVLPYEPCRTGTTTTMGKVPRKAQVETKGKEES